MVSKATQAAVSSMRWFVVLGSPPLISRVLPLHLRTAA